MPVVPFIPAALEVGASIFGANKQADAAQSAANAQSQNDQAAIAEEQRQYNLTRGDEMPYMNAGTGAIADMQAANNGDWSKFHLSPDFQFTQQQGIQGLDRSAAMRGMEFDPAHLVDLVNYNQGLAEQQYGNYYNRLAGIASLGQDAASRTGNIGAQTANGIANQYNNIGNAQANGIVGSANAWSNGLGALSGLFQKQLSGSSYGDSSSGGVIDPSAYMASGSGWG